MAAIALTFGNTKSTDIYKKIKDLMSKVDAKRAERDALMDKLVYENDQELVESLAESIKEKQEEMYKLEAALRTYGSPEIIEMMMDSHYGFNVQF